ncbi:hypothetical protein [Mesorhizobium sp.]|uniref:hypothetical protein n=1 Tax=Mesorhizobium sp. TaxID=1871066 RepID=UPI0025BB6482|nr:hypothetical protein [Mesorhizobium sp.]
MSLDRKIHDVDVPRQRLGAQRAKLRGWRGKHRYADWNQSRMGDARTVDKVDFLSGENGREQLDGWLPRWMAFRVSS